MILFMLTKFFHSTGLREMIGFSGVVQAQHWSQLFLEGLYLEVLTSEIQIRVIRLLLVRARDNSGVTTMRYEFPKIYL